MRNDMRFLIPSAIAGAAVGVGLTTTLGRDYAAVGVSTAGALAYVLVAYSLAPAIADPARKSVLAPGLFGIAVFSILIFAYGALNIVLGRPNWFMNGWPFIGYTAAFGGLIGSVLTHLLSLGRAQGRTKEYLIYLGVVVLFALILTFANWAYNRPL